MGAQNYHKNQKLRIILRYRGKEIPEKYQYQGALAFLPTLQSTLLVNLVRHHNCDLITLTSSVPFAKSFVKQDTGRAPCNGISGFWSCMLYSIRDRTAIARRTVLTFAAEDRHCEEPDIELDQL